LVGAHLFKTFSPYVELEGPSPCLQKLTAGPYPGTFESSPHTLTLSFFKFSFVISCPPVPIFTPSFVPSFLQFFIQTTVTKLHVYIKVRTLIKCRRNGSQMTLVLPPPKNFSQPPL